MGKKFKFKLKKEITDNEKSVNTPLIGGCCFLFFSEKEDLVNAVLHSVSVPQNVRRSSSGSCPSTPRRSSLVLGPSCSRSSNDLPSLDGIRVNGVSRIHWNSPKTHFHSRRWIRTQARRQRHPASRNSW